MSEASSAGAAGVWVPVAQRLPSAGCKVLVFYVNRYGLSRRTCAHYAPLHTIEALGWDENGPEPDETEDGVFEPKGWWEQTVESEHMGFIADEVTHWMPLPKPPVVYVSDGEKLT